MTFVLKTLLLWTTTNLLSMAFLQFWGFLNTVFFCIINRLYSTSSISFPDIMNRLQTEMAITWNNWFYLRNITQTYYVAYLLNNYKPQKYAGEVWRHFPRALSAYTSKITVTSVNWFTHFCIMTQSPCNGHGECAYMHKVREPAP